LNFVLSAADVAYINSLSPKQVILKVTADRAAGGQSFTLRADHFIFRVTP
jgi:hypothetical protein